MEKKKRLPRRKDTGNCLVSLQAHPDIHEIVPAGSSNYTNLGSFQERLANGARVRLEGDWWRVAMWLRLINNPKRVELEKKGFKNHLFEFNPMDRPPTKNGKKTRREKPTNARFALLWYSKEKVDEAETEIDPKLKKKMVRMTFEVPVDRVKNVKKFLKGEVDG